VQENVCELALIVGSVLERLIGALEDGEGVLVWLPSLVVASQPNGIYAYV